MKLNLLILFALCYAYCGFAQINTSTTINPNGTQSTTTHNGNTSTMVNSDGTFTNTYHNGNTSTTVNPDGTFTNTYHNGNTSTTVNPDGSFSNTYHNGNTSTTINPDGTFSNTYHTNQGVQNTGQVNNTANRLSLQAANAAGQRKMDEAKKSRPEIYKKKRAKLKVLEGEESEMQVGEVGREENVEKSTKKKKKTRKKSTSKKKN